MGKEERLMGSVATRQLGLTVFQRNARQFKKREVCGGARMMGQLR